MCGRHINSFSCFCNVCKPDKPLPSPLPLQDVHGCTVWSVHCSGPVHGHGALLLNSLLWLHPGHRVSHSCRQHSNSQTVVCVGVGAQSGVGLSRAVEHPALTQWCKVHCTHSNILWLGGRMRVYFTALCTLGKRILSVSIVTVPRSVSAVQWEVVPTTLLPKTDCCLVTLSYLVL